MIRSSARAVLCAAVLALIYGCSSTSTPPTLLQVGSNSSARTLIENGTPVAGTQVLPPHQIVGTGLIGQIAKPSENVIYHNGQVSTFPAIGLVYWGFNRRDSDPDSEIPRLNSFLMHLRASVPLSVVTQYYEVVNGHKYHIPNYPAMSIAIWKDAVDPLPLPHPTDADVQQEALRAAAHFQFALPNVDTLIIVAIPHGIPMNYAACAYHGKVNGLPYTNLPYQPDFGAGCGAYSVNPGPLGKLDGVTETAIHEITESMTDPQFFGWYDAHGAEIGDKCQQFAANADFNGKPFAVQPLWSNRTSDCRY